MFRGSDSGLKQPVASDTLTRYEPLVFTVMPDVVSPVDQRYESPGEEFSSRLSPSQKSVLPLNDIVGLGGAGFVVTVVMSESGLQHPSALLTWTV
jgi:hypothetical protein